MNSFSKWLLVVGLMLSSSTSVASNKSKLYGTWKGVSSPSIEIRLMKNMRYKYRYKMITFTGKWSLSGKNLTFHYSVLGSKKKKKATYSLRKSFLTLRSHEHSTVVLKKKK